MLISGISGTVDMFAIQCRIKRLFVSLNSSMSTIEVLEVEYILLTVYTSLALST